jgi:conjugative transfer signal peptidase TraF
MPKPPSDTSALSMADWKAERARIKDQRRRALRNESIALGIGLAALCATIIVIPRPVFVWNVSASAVIGLYFVSSKSGLERGDMAALWLPPRHRKLAAQRRYLPQNIAAIKRVVAVQGDSVCALGSRISVNGRWIADRHPTDGKGRPMPWWQNCKRLGKDELFLLNEEAANSFDGRYIGISKTSDVIGEASLIWRD